MMTKVIVAQLVGLPTASVVFIPLGIAADAALGPDKLSGIAIVALGVNARFTAGIFSPFSVGIARGIAELPLFSGEWLRWVTLPVLLTVTSAYITLYVKRHRVPVSSNENDIRIHAMTLCEKISVVAFIVGFLLLTVGISVWNWATDGIVVAFFVIGSAVGLVAGMPLNTVCDTFLAGCRKMMRGVLVNGIAATSQMEIFWTRSRIS